MEHDTVVFEVVARGQARFSLAIKDDVYVILRDGQLMPNCQYPLARCDKAVTEFRRLTRRSRLLRAIDHEEELRPAAAG